MTNKEFYRFGEKRLEQLVTKSDIFSFLDGGSISAFIRLENIPCLLANVDDPSIGMGTAKIEGYSILSVADALDCLRKGSTTVGQVDVLAASLKSYSSDYPFSSSLPLSPLKSWSQEPSLVPNRLYRAFLKPKEQDTVQSTIKHALQKLVPDFQNIKAGNVSADAYLTQFGEREIRAQGIKIELINIFIDGSQLQEALAARITSSSIDRARLKATEVPDNDLYLDIFNFLKANPEASASDVWDILTKEHESGGFPSIDLNGSIDAISSTGLRYYDDNGKTKDIKKKSFQNNISSLKKVL